MGGGAFIDTSGSSSSYRRPGASIRYFRWIGIVRLSRQTLAFFALRHTSSPTEWFWQASERWLVAGVKVSGKQ